MGLLDFVQQQHTVRRLGHCFGKQPTLVIAHIPWRRANQPADGVTLHVLGHVEPHQLHTQGPGQLTTHLGLAHPGGAGKHEAADGLVLALEAGTGQLDGCRDGVDGLFLAEHGHLQVPLQVAQQLLVRRGHLLGRNAGNLRHHVFHIGFVDGVLALIFRAQALPGPYLVDYVDGLVRQVAIIDITGTQFRRRFQGRIAVAHIMMLLETTFQPLENPHGIFHGGLHHIDLLEAT